MTGNLAALVTESAEERHSRIHQTIRERISLLHYPPNTTLSESELALEFGVSRTPIRRVLQRLDFEGLVDIRNGVGTIVTEIDLRTMKEVYDLRMHLCDLVPDTPPGPASAAQIEVMEALLERTKQLEANPDREGYGRLCNDLHSALLSLTRSAPLREINDTLYYRVARIWFSFLPYLDWQAMIADQEKEVESMLTALRRGDLKSLGQIRKQHLKVLIRRVSSYLGSSGPAN